MRFKVDATAGAIYVNGNAVVDVTADVYLNAGLHDLAIFATGTGTLSASRAHENRNSANVTLAAVLGGGFFSGGRDGRANRR